MRKFKLYTFTPFYYDGFIDDYGDIPMFNEMFPHGIAQKKHYLGTVALGDDYAELLLGRMIKDFDCPPAASEDFETDMDLPMNAKLKKLLTHLGYSLRHVKWSSICNDAMVEFIKRQGLSLPPITSLYFDEIED